MFGPVARDLRQEQLTRRVPSGELTFDREWVEGTDGEIRLERFTNGRLDGKPISDRELRLLLNH